MEPGSPEKTVPVHKDIVESKSPGNMGHAHAHNTESGSSKDAHKGSQMDYVPNGNGTFHILWALGILTNYIQMKHHSISDPLSKLHLMCFPLNLFYMPSNVA